MWLYVPSVSAQDTAGSTSPLTSQQAGSLARSVMWRSKYRQPGFWQTLWQSKFYRQRLSGPTCEPSTLERGVESWIASLRDTLASPSPSPESVVEKAIQDTCGPKWRESWMNASPLLASSRTCQATLFSDLTPSPKTWSDWVTALRQECLRRRKLARATRENGCSSWLTPHGMIGMDSTGKEAHGGEFAKQATTWRTARSNDWKGGVTRDQGSSRAETDFFLPDQVNQWATPASADCQGSHGGGQVRSLRTDIAEKSSPPDLATSNPGGESLLNTPTSRPQLNPDFVEWLMGVPHGWTACECSETEWSLYRARMRSSLLRLCSDSLSVKEGGC